MEVERLVEKLRTTWSELESYAVDCSEDHTVPAHLSMGCMGISRCPIHLNRRRTVATVAKMLVDQGEERAAGVLVQMFGAGEPYEVCDARD